MKMISYLYVMGGCSYTFVYIHFIQRREMFLLLMYRYILILSNEDDFIFICYGGLQLHICIYSFYSKKGNVFIIDVYILILSNEDDFTFMCYPGGCSYIFVYIHFI